LGEAKELYTTNFSFKFSRLLRDATRESIEKVLIRLGEYDIDFVKDFLSGAETTETELKTLLAEKITANILENETVLKELSQGSGLDEGAVQNLLDIIKAKFTDEINSADLDCEVDGTGDTDLTKLKELWSYRLYYKPSDNVVRNGDIIKSNDGGGYFLVTTPNCNLHRFWHKNFGYINLIRLLEITEEGDKIKDHLSLTRNMGGDGGVKKTIKNTKPTSVCNTPNGYPEGCFVLPFVDCAGVSSSLVGFPCAITSINIEPRPLSEGGTPKCRNRDLLRYSQWDDFERIATISEPFLAPIIQNAIGAISGQGVPDYPKRIKMAIKQEFESFHNDL
ncbi:hypothetical protein KAR91_42880, partial [Candidatus Pacearchaeota archaeon]|nr:hypothetical protein [Candidatus Pacearchaeota archaeon]